MGRDKVFSRRAKALAAGALLCSAMASAAIHQDSAKTVSHLATPAGLRCDGRVEPLAVGDAQPEFSWGVKGTSPLLHSVRQSSYQVRVAARRESLIAGRALIWDTGRVDGDATSNVKRYAGRALEPQHDYWWQVRAWDENGRATDWSQAARWTQAPEWRAQWIAAHATDTEVGREAMPLLRKTFNVAGRVKRAVLYVSGLGQYEVHINGAKVGDQELAPGWSDYHKTVFYDSYDITPMMRTGGNAIGVMLGNGMYRVPPTPGRYNKFTGSFGPPKCITQLDLELADGRRVEVDSDGSWKTKPGPITFSSTYGGEDYDARSETGGWDRATFNDADWNAVVVTGGPGGALRPELAPAIKVIKTYVPVHETELKPRATVYDLGQNFAGWPSIEVSGAAGATVKLIAGELLNADGTVSQASSAGPQWFSYTLKGTGTEHWHPRFSYYGFRYVQVEGAEKTGRTRLISLRGEAVHTSSEQVGGFESSDTLLNRIHTLIVRAIENNAMSLLTDCPHREKLGWLEETHLLAPSLLYDFDFSGLYAATARNIADAQTGDGSKAGRVPEIAPQYVLFGPNWGVFDDSPEWGSAAILAPWYVYERNGDLAALESHLEVMRRYADYLQTRAKDDIIDYGLGDWYDIGPGEPGFSKLTTAGVTATAIYYQDLRALERTLAMAGRSDLSREYGQRADAVKEAFNERFFDAAHHRYDKGSQTAQAMPLALGMAPEHERGAVLSALIADIRAHNNHVTAGDVGYHYVVDALLANGRSDVLYDMLERTDSPSYGYQLAQGATALTEAWDANPKSSQDHFMLGDAEEWFYRGLGGIGVNFFAEPSQRLTLRPKVVGNLSWVHTHYVCTLGRVESNWKRGSEQTEYEFVVPANVSAAVELATAIPNKVKIDGVAADKARGVSDVRTSVEGIKFSLGSGRYRISAPNAIAVKQ